MRRGLLQDYANQVCQMAVGWRLAISDLALLAERGEGLVAFDLLARTTDIGGLPVPLTIMDEVMAWVGEAEGRDNLPAGLIQSFTMELAFRVAEEQNGRAEIRHVDLDCTSLLVTADAECAGRSSKREVWTRTKPDTAWFVQDV